MTVLEQQLRASVAMPQLIHALELLLPLAQAEYQARANALGAIDDKACVTLLGEQLLHETDQWLEAVMIAKIALKSAVPVEPPPSNVVMMPTAGRFPS